MLFCRENNYFHLPSQKRYVAEFLEVVTRATTRLGGHVNQACAAIGQAHKAAGFQDPTNTNLMQCTEKE